MQRKSLFKDTVELGVGIVMIGAVISIYGIGTPVLIASLKMVDAFRRATAFGLDVAGEVFPTARDLARRIDNEV